MIIGRESLIRHAVFLLPLNINTFVTGCVIGWLPQALYKLQDPKSQLRATAEQCSWLASLTEVGRCLSAIPIGLLVDRFGKRCVTLSIGTLYLSCFILQTVTSSVNVLYVLRIFYGVGIAGMNTVNAIYIGELSSAEVRGAAASFNSSLYNAGILFQIIIGKFLTFSQIALITSLFPIAFLLVSDCLVETPNDLVAKNDYEGARENLEWLRKGKSREEIDREFDSLSNYVRGQRNVGFSEVTRDLENLKSVATVCVLYCAITLTGGPSIMIYLSFLIPSTEYFHSTDFPVMFASITYVAALFAPLIVDRVDRKLFVCVSSCLSAAPLATLMVVYYATREINAQIPAVSWILLLSVSAHACLMSGGVGPATLAMRGEILPHSIKGVGSGIAAVTSAICNFVVIHLFQIVNRTAGLYCNFLFFLIATLSFALFVFFALPETRGKLLSEIQEEERIKKKTIDSKELKIIERF